MWLPSEHKGVGSIGSFRRSGFAAQEWRRTSSPLSNVEGMMSNQTFSMPESTWTNPS